MKLTRWQHLLSNFLYNCNYNMEGTCDDDEKKCLSFYQMGLDDRILKEISRLGWMQPTLIQERAIPFALEGKDILARARTGSGKTAAFAVPIIQQILQKKKFSKAQDTKALVLAPTKELCQQIYKNFKELTRSCSREVHCMDTSRPGDIASQRPLLMENPDVIIGTPKRILSHLQEGNINLKESLEMLVIDEADLVFSFGYENNVKEILKFLPEIHQSFLMSATMSDDVKILKKIVLHNPVILKLEDSLASSNQLLQYHIKCEEEDKFVLIYSLFKLNLIRGKSIIFVNTVDKCYRIKLFLEQFGIKSCILNSELPLASRCHIVLQFNEGIYDIIIASDETVLNDPSKTKTKRNRKRRRDKEFGVSRGIDFQFVSNIINFDFPPDVVSYIHRVGRTARGMNEGTALSFISIKELPLMEKVDKHLSNDETESIFKPYQFRMEELEGFRYRARDVMKAITKIAIREARLKDIRKEILNSEKLKTYFEEHPQDLQILRHDKVLHVVKLRSHLKDVPEYIVPPTLKKLAKNQNKRRRIRPQQQQISKAEQKFKKRKADPLQSFEFQGFSKKKKKQEEET